MALSADNIHNHNLTNYSDNIINLANQAGFHTMWLSAQTAFGNYGSSVAGIAMNAEDKLYIKGYDKELLPHLKTALQAPAHDKNLSFCTYMVAMSQHVKDTPRTKPYLINRMI